MFGSRARGDTHEDSDFDFFVIMDTDEKPIRRGFPVRKVGRIPGVPMDFLVRTPAEWERGFPLKKEIVAEGSVLFEKPNGTVGDELTSLRSCTTKSVALRPISSHDHLTCALRVHPPIGG
ncbi:MAG: nucleotidyltransferase domain-containing protein [Bacilli bacterium]